MTLDDGTPPPASFIDELAYIPEPDDSGPMVAAGGEALCFEPPTQTPGIPSFVLASEPVHDLADGSWEEPTAPALAHPRLIPRSRTRFARASSPMPAPDPEAAVGLPSPVAHPQAAPLYLTPRLPRHRFR